VLGTALAARLATMGLAAPRFLSPQGRKLGEVGALETQDRAAT
jgi:hypothetical protein